MTIIEQRILELIKKNPNISPIELSKSLDITSSSIAVNINNLIKKGYISEKKYEYVTVIGGVNIDIIGFPNSKLVFNDSNPGRVKMSLGGVGRNIAENLARLGVNTKLISAFGDDLYGKMVMDESRLIGLNLDDSLVLEGKPTSTYLAVLDEKRDMKIAISHMDILEYINIDFIKDKKHIIENSKVCLIDTNIPKETIEFILTNHKNTDFFLDTVSTTKAMKVKDIIGSFHTIKPNKLEAEILSGVKINDEKDLEICSEYFLNKGVKRVFISLGEKGLYYNDGENKRQIPAEKLNVVNATGAGDAFIAALIYCYCNDFDIDFSARFAMAASVLALSHEDTINPNMSVENVNNIIK